MLIEDNLLSEIIYFVYFNSLSLGQQHALFAAHLSWLLART